jgi:hypothetical protein
MCEGVPVNSIQIADETFVAASPARVSALIADRRNWRRWWPDLALGLREDRADKGIRWTVGAVGEGASRAAGEGASRAAGSAVDGTMEVWLEPCMDGTLVHYFLHGEPAGPDAGRPGRELAEIVGRRRAAGKAMAFEVKLRAERGRTPGGPAAG